MGTDVRRPSLENVLAKIVVVFPDRDPQSVLSVLDRYGTEGHEQEQRRVQLAILKLCDEAACPDLERTVEDAKEDFSDVLVWAESPNLSARSATTDAREKQKLAAKDEAQYLAWLKGG